MDFEFRNGAPYAPLYDDYYYSFEDGWAESRYVFFAGNGLPARWRGQTDFHIFELGFGTSLNFLMTWREWREDSTASRRLHYTAVEGAPLTPEQMRQAINAWPELSSFVTLLLEQWPRNQRGFHRLEFDNGRVVLDLLLADVEMALAQHRGQVDAWYLDGFAPARNQAMWSPKLFHNMAAKSVLGATFSTFTSAGQVRRDLQSVGAVVRKRSGFGRKRESLHGEFKGTQPSDVKPQSVTVVGAGIAGATAAAAFKRRGWRVRVVEAQKIAAGASGNPSGILEPVLSAEDDPLTRIMAQAFEYAGRFYQRMGWKPDGLVRLAENDADEARLQRALGLLEGLGSYVSPNRASELIGQEVLHGGVWFPGAGAIDPAWVCRRLLTDIECLERTEVHRLESTTGGWSITTSRGTLSSDVVVLANAYEIRKFAQTAWMPCHSVRGQLADVQLTTRFKCALSQRHYVIPMGQDRHLLGATFDRDSKSSAFDLVQHRQLLSALGDMTSDSLRVTSLPLGRVSFRSMSQDRLPFVGAVPAAITPNRHFDGLYVLSALGSRGLTSAPLMAELIASMATHRPLPLQSDLVDKLSPIRFLLRDQRRGAPPPQGLRRFARSPESGASLL